MTDTFTGETYNALCGDAEGYLASGAPEQARELLLKAVSLIGTRSRARSLLADTCMSMELWPEAREQLEILITLEEGDTRNNFRLGQVLEELGEYQLAADNYTVVLNENPRHHGTMVALKRIAVRTSESGVNLADIFTSSSSSSVAGAEERSIGQGVPLEAAGARIDGMQVFPDLPSDEVFADAEGADANLTLNTLLENMGVRSTPDGWKAEDVSKLLDDVAGSDNDQLQSMFAGKPAPAGEKRADSPGLEPFSSSSPDLESIFAGTAPVSGKTQETGKTTQSLEDIFGTSMRPSSPWVPEPEPVALEPEVVEVEVPEPEAPEPAAVEAEVPEPEAPEPAAVEAEVPEPEAPEPAAVEEEVLEPEAPEPAAVEEEVLEPEAPEPAAVEEEVLEPEAPEPAAVEVEVLAPEALDPAALKEEIPEPEMLEPETLEEEAAEAATFEPAVPMEAEEAGPEGAGDLQFAAEPDPSVFSSMDALEAIFSAAASTVITGRRDPETRMAPEEPVPVPVEPEPVPEEPVPVPEMEVPLIVPAQPLPEGAPVAPEVVEIQPAAAVQENEPIGLEVIFGAEPEMQETETVEEAVEQIPVPTLPVGIPAESPADFFVEPWSPETGLVSVTLFSGALSVRTALLAAFESSLVCEPDTDGICAVRGEGTLMLNCGPVEPLMLEAEEGMTVRTALLALVSPEGGTLRALPVGGLSRLLSADGTRLLFQTGSPARKVLLEGGTSALLVRSGSLAAASPGVEISEDSVLTGYLTATGQGRLYLIE